MPAHLVGAIEKSCSSVKRPCLTGWAMSTPANALVVGLNPLDSRLQDSGEFAQSVLNLFSIDAAIP
jgi:hypothetical protein